jgi:hypothetical protein
MDSSAVAGIGPATRDAPRDSATAGSRAPADSTPAASALETLAAPGDPDAAGEMDAQTDKPAAISRTGWLSVTSEPAAEVYIDDVYIGDTPLPRFELTNGSHTLICKSPKHDVYQETVIITTGEISSRNIVLRRITGRVSLSTIEGAEVYVDGSLLGVTPLKGPVELEAGSHQITIKKAGFHVWNNSISVEAKQLLPLRITLSPIY